MNLCRCQGRVTDYLFSYSYQSREVMIHPARTADRVVRKSSSIHSFIS